MERWEQSGECKNMHVYAKRKVNTFRTLVLPSLISTFRSKLTLISIKQGSSIKYKTLRFWCVFIGGAEKDREECEIKGEKCRKTSNPNTYLKINI